MFISDVSQLVKGLKLYSKVCLAVIESFLELIHVSELQMSQPHKGWHLYLIKKICSVVI